MVNDLQLSKTSSTALVERIVIGLFMATISKLQPGQVLYQIQRQKCGNTMVSRGCLYEVRVVSIAEDGKSIMASWNGNPPRRFYQKQVASLRVKKPQPKGQVFGMESY